MRRPARTISLSPEVIQTLDDIGEAYRLNRPQIIRMAVARLKAEPPTLAELAIISEEQRNPDDPSPQQIEAAKAEIRESWGPAELHAREHPPNEKGRGRRPRMKPNGWTPPTVRNHYG